jgi:hopanoid-associated phosphorylase
VTAAHHHLPGIVVGLRAEARIAARKRYAFGDPAQVTALVEAGVPALVSFGLAGGLDPRLAPGTLVLADSVVLPDGNIVATDSVWRERVRMKLAPTITTVVAPVAGSDELVDDPTAKAELWTRTAAAAVDMESHIAVQAAERAGLALLVLRAIADPAAGALPPAIRRGFTPDGRLHLFAVLGSAARSPSQIPDLVRLARDARTALATLGRAVKALGPQFGFDGAPAS